MPSDVAPEILAKLDGQLAEGEIDKATYDVQRAKMLSAAQKGRTLRYTWPERWRWVAEMMLILAAAITLLVLQLVLPALALIAWFIIRFIKR